MGIQARSARRAAATVFTLATAFATCTAAATAATASTTAAGPRHAAPHQAAVVRTVSPAGQRATRTFWTSGRMAAATPLPVPEPLRAGAPASPPHGIPNPTKFSGVPTVGTLFFTTGTQAHFCTASVVDSITLNIVLTAAHCVYGTEPATNVEYVPEYHAGHEPYGAWPVQTITVAPGWQQDLNPTLDFAFLTVTPPSGGHLPVQLVTGGLWLGINPGYDNPIEVIGYNNTQNVPIRCATKSFAYQSGQTTYLKFFCNAFWDGTSGGPWIVNYNAGNGTGMVIGVIGGYEQGGNYPWASYTAYFGFPTLQLFLQAQRQQF
jgi:V8-like Glu-specific endopeptidase